MKYQRSTLTIAHGRMRHAGDQLTVKSLQVGEWHAHVYNGAELGDGVTVAHKSGIATTWYGVRPATAVRLLRAYQTLPPCPVDDQELQSRIREGTTRQVPALREWLAQALRITQDIIDPERRIYVRD